MRRRRLGPAPGLIARRRHKSHGSRESRAALCKIRAPPAHRNSLRPIAALPRATAACTAASERCGGFGSAAPCWARKHSKKHQGLSSSSSKSKCSSPASTPPHDLTPVSTQALREARACKHQCTSLALGEADPNGRAAQQSRFRDPPRAGTPKPSVRLLAAAPQRLRKHFPRGCCCLWSEDGPIRDAGVRCAAAAAPRMVRRSRQPLGSQILRVRVRLK